MWKRLIAVLCVLVCLFALVPAASAVDETVYVRKHVSLLYDDSGSMNQNAGNLKWCYASYAAQTFAGLLNDTDTLSLTFMKVGEPAIPVDLTQDRQQTVTSVMEYTSGSDNDTPIGQIDEALKALDLGDAQGENDQYWLVLTTDGVFYDGNGKCSEEKLVSKIKGILEQYPELKVVYFGIGTENDRSDQKAIDLKNNSVLKGYSNFSAEYAESHTEIVSTMRLLANRIAGRYDVDDTVSFSGNTVTLDISGETSPIRNISVFAQNTKARLVSAVASNGKALSVDRSASIVYPYNGSYTNVAEGTLGGYTALVETGSEEKIPAGKVTLTFSEAIAEKDLSLMYEPAIYIDLQVERKNAEGKWEKIGSGDKLYEGDELRVDYAICEDGTNVELDTKKLFGKTETHIAYNGETLESGKSFTAVEGSQRLTVDLSLMDGLYKLSSGRTITVTKPGASDYEIRSSGSLTMTRDEIAENKQAHVSFEVLLGGVPADAARMKSFELKAEGLNGKSERAEQNVLRFTPKDGKCQDGDYAVTLLFEGTVVAEEKVTVKPNPTTYSARASGGITIMSNRVADNDQVVTFDVTAHCDEGDRPITAEEAALFRVETVGNGGQTMDGKTAFAGEGKLTFMPQDAQAAVGDYTAQLKLQDQTLAQAPVVVLLHNMEYSIKTAVRETDTAEWFELRKNKNHVAFAVYGDGEACTAAQLQAMLDSGNLIVSHSPENKFLQITVTQGLLDGDAALICTPDGTGGFMKAFFRGLNGLFKEPVETLQIGLTVDMPKGDEAAEQMTITYEKRGIWRLVLLVLFLFAVIVAWEIACHRLSAKMKKGKIVKCKIRVSCDRLYKNQIDTVYTGKTFRLRLVPRPERVSGTDNITYYADSGEISRQRGVRGYPSFEIKKSKEELENFRWSYVPSDDRLIFLKEICKGRKRKTISADIKKDGRSINMISLLEDKVWKTAIKAQIEEDGTGKRVCYGAFDGSYSYIISSEMEKEQLYYYLWIYIENKQRKERRTRSASRRWEDLNG